MAAWGEKEGDWKTAFLIIVLMITHFYGTATKEHHLNAAMKPKDFYQPPTYRSGCPVDIQTAAHWNCVARAARNGCGQRDSGSSYRIRYHRLRQLTSLFRTGIARRWVMLKLYSALIQPCLLTGDYWWTKNVSQETLYSSEYTCA